MISVKDTSNPKACSLCNEVEPDMLQLQVKWPGFEYLKYISLPKLKVCEDCHDALHQLGIEHSSAE